MFHGKISPTAAVLTLLLAASTLSQPARAAAPEGSQRSQVGTSAREAGASADGAASTVPDAGSPDKGSDPGATSDTSGGGTQDGAETTPKDRTDADTPPQRGTPTPGETTGDATPPDRTPPTDPHQPGGRDVGKLPDAVVILDIIRRLPKWPPQRPFDDEEVIDDEPRDPPTTPNTTPQRDQPAVKRPQRVVNVAPNARFTPVVNAPRAPTAPPVVLGNTGPEALEREVLVTLTPGSADATVFALAQDFGLDGQTLYVSALLGTRVVRFRIPDTRSVADVVSQLAADARVAIATPHYVYTASQGAAKPLPVPQYAPDKLKLAEAHKIASGKRIKIAVIDTAVDVAHPVFAGARIETFDALGDKGGPEAHGTAIAAIAGARAELQSVAPAADLLSVRAFTAAKGTSAKSYTMAILKGLDWAVLSGARVVNMSFAGPQDPILAKAIEAAETRGLVLIAAAGNGGPNAAPAYPAAYPAVLAVTATDDRDGLYRDANRGSYIAVAAPGVDIIAAAPGGAYDISSGTSLAAAHISGIAALMLERNPKLTAAEIRATLQKSAHKPSGAKPEEVGAGVADAAAALQVVP